MINFGRLKSELGIPFINLVLDKLGGDVSSYMNSNLVMVMVRGRMSYCTVMGKLLKEVREQVDPSQSACADEFSPAVPRSMDVQPWAKDTMLRQLAESFDQTDLNELLIAFLGDTVDEELYTAEHHWHGSHANWNDTNVPTWHESLLSVYSTIQNRMKEGAKVLVITGNKQHLSPGNVPDWNALQKKHPYQITWMPDIRQGSSDLSHESCHSGNHFGVHVHATELAALINVPLNNIVAVPDTATMMWVEAKCKDQVSLKQDFLMQNPPV
jgi:hypothetical protein